MCDGNVGVQIRWPQQLPLYEVCQPSCASISNEVWLLFEHSHVLVLGACQTCSWKGAQIAQIEDIVVQGYHD